MFFKRMKFWNESNKKKWRKGQEAVRKEVFGLGLIYFIVGTTSFFFFNAAFGLLFVVFGGLALTISAFIASNIRQREVYEEVKALRKEQEALNKKFEKMVDVLKEALSVA